MNEAQEESSGTLDVEYCKEKNKKQRYTLCDEHNIWVFSIPLGCLSYLNFQLLRAEFTMLYF